MKAHALLASAAVIIMLSCTPDQPLIPATPQPADQTAAPDVSSSLQHTEVAQATAACPGLGTSGSDHVIGLYLGTVAGTTGAGVRFLDDTTVICAVDSVLQWRKSRTGQIIRSLVPGGGTCYDMYAEGGRIAVIGKGGVFVFTADGTKLWSSGTVYGAVPVSPSHVTIAADGHVGALSSGNIEIFGPTGARVSALKVGNTVNDIAIAPDLDLFYLCGFTQATSILQKPWIFAYSLSGTQKWTNYNTTLAGLGADTRCNAVYYRSGKLYMCGEQAGGGSPFDRDPKDITRTIKNGGSSPDGYQTPNNLNGAAHIGYIASFDASGGNWLNGTHFLTRLSTGKGNALKPSDLSVDALGRISVTGDHASSIANVNNIRVNGTTMPNAGIFMAIFNADFCRQLWVTLGTAGKGIAIATRNGSSAVLTSSATSAVLTSGTATAGAYLAFLPIGGPDGNTHVLRQFTPATR